MNQEQVHARHLVELGFLEQIVTDMGYAAQLVERSAQFPYHTLLIRLEPDARGRQMHMALTYYPIGEEAQDTLFLQYFVELPFETDGEGLARVRELLPEINNRLVVGHMGIAGGTDKVHYRYVQALPQDRVVSKVAVADVLVLTTYTPHLFGELLERVAAGSTSLEQARAELAAQYGEM